MRRVQLFEIAELPWCPRAVRDGLTDYLSFMIARTNPYAPAASLLADVWTRDAATGEPRQVVDLAAGAGGPWHALFGALSARGIDVRVRLTDRFPNTDAFAHLERETHGVIIGEPRPVDAGAVPPDLCGFRTMFSAFHHFAPPDAHRVLADAVARRAGIAVFEATRRDIRAVILTLLTPIIVLLVTPLLRPFRWSRLLLTYVLPAIPFAVLFDGVISCLRTYTPEELRALAARAADDGYVWNAGEIGPGPIPMTYLIGYPRARETPPGSRRAEDGSSA